MIQEYSTDTGDQYEYRKTVSIQKTSTNTEKQYNLENSISTGFKLFTTIKERKIGELSSRQANIQASVHPSEAKRAGMNLTYNTRRHHIRLGYRSRHG